MSNENEKLEAWWVCSTCHQNNNKSVRENLEYLRFPVAFCPRCNSIMGGPYKTEKEAIYLLENRDKESAYRCSLCEYWYSERNSFYILSRKHFACSNCFKGLCIYFRLQDHHFSLNIREQRMLDELCEEIEERTGSKPKALEVKND